MNWTIPRKKTIVSPLIEVTQIDMENILNYFYRRTLRHNSEYQLGGIKSQIVNFLGDKCRSYDVDSASFINGMSTKIEGIEIRHDYVLEKKTYSSVVYIYLLGPTNYTLGQTWNVRLVLPQFV